jgi:hypothetical protein
VLHVLVQDVVQRRVLLGRADEVVHLEDGSRGEGGGERDSIAFLSMATINRGIETKARGRLKLNHRWEKFDSISFLEENPKSFIFFVVPL